MSIELLNQKLAFHDITPAIRAVLRASKPAVAAALPAVLDRCRTRRSGSAASWR
jgi:hypothetical protein